MKKYFYRIGHVSNGPFAYSEFVKLPLEKDTSVRAEGWDHWENASEVEELKYLFTKGMPAPLIEEKRSAFRTNPGFLFVVLALSVASFIFLYNYYSNKTQKQQASVIEIRD